jgi:hypothetical protein
MAKGHKVLTYQHALKDVPEGVNPIYRRSGYIHPLYSPDGHVLTRIQPPDHYHHYGIWNPWTKTHIEGQEVDFWNLAKGMGTVRFAGVKSIRTSTGNAGFTVKQEHVQLKGSNKAPRVAIEEILDIHVTVGKTNAKTSWFIRFTSTLKNALDVPIELDQYRYGGGLGFRATEKWKPEKTTVLTSEGKSRKDADGTRARWCDVNGEFDDKTNVGILFLDHPDNYDHPQPVRVWPKGDMFFEFCPIRLTSWTLEPGKEYKQEYRMLVYEGKMKPESAERLWEFYKTTSKNKSQK